MTKRKLIPPSNHSIATHRNSTMHTNHNRSSGHQQVSKKSKGSYARRYRHYRVRLGYGILMAFFAAITAGCDQAPIQQAPSSTGVWLSAERAAPSPYDDQSPMLALAASNEPSAEKEQVEYSIIELPESKVCEGVVYRDTQGVIRRGSQACTYEECSSNGATDCKVMGDFRATDVNAIDRRLMKKGYFIAGLEGSFDQSQYPDCTKNGQKNCTIKGQFKAIDSSVLKPGNLARDFSIQGVVTGGYPSANHPFADSPHSTTQLTALNANWALRTTNQFHFWDANGNLNLIKGDSNLSSSNILTDQTIYGINGSSPIITAPTCTASANTKCDVAAGWRGVDKNELKPELIKKDVTIGQVTGGYPSADHRLADHTAMADLDNSFFTKLTQNDKFEFFDRKGQRHEERGDTELTATSLKQGQTILGVTGSFNGVDYSKIKQRDIRTGVTYKGTTKGSLDLTRNCYYENKTEQEACLKGIWQDLASTLDSGATACTDSASNCMFRNTINDLKWIFEINGTQRTWASTVSYCDGLTLGGSTNWRIPTHKEVLQASVHGLGFLGLFTTSYYNNRSPLKFWSATTDTAEAGGQYRLAYFPELNLFDIANMNTHGDAICVTD